MTKLKARTPYIFLGNCRVCCVSVKGQRSSPFGAVSILKAESCRTQHNIKQQWPRATLKAHILWSGMEYGVREINSLVFSAFRWGGEYYPHQTQVKYLCTYEGHHSVLFVTIPCFCWSGYDLNLPCTTCFLCSVKIYKCIQIFNIYGCYK